MKKLFITGALLLSAVSFTTVQAKESKVTEAGGGNKVSDCRYASIYHAWIQDGNEYGSPEFQSAYLGYYKDCMGY